MKTNKNNKKSHAFRGAAALITAAILTAALLFTACPNNAGDSGSGNSGGGGGTPGSEDAPADVTGRPCGTVRPILGAHRPPCRCRSH